MDPNHIAMMLALPQFFQSEPQQATLSQCLWSEEGTNSIIIHLRLYDILRRLYYIKTGKNATPLQVLTCMEKIIENDDMKNYLMSFAISGVFPDEITLRSLKN